MDTTIEQQVAMDEALVPHAQRLRIGRSNFCLLSDIKSKESTLQLVYDVLPPKPKASVWKTRSSSDTSITPPTTAACPRLTNSAKGKQAAKATKAKSLSALFENSTDDEGDDNEEKDDDGDEEDEGDDGEEGDGDDDDEDNDGKEGDDDDVDQEVERDDDEDDEEKGGDDEHEIKEEKSDEETRDEESFDHIPQTPKNNKDEGNGEEDLSLNIGGEERHVEEEEEDELYKDQSSSVSSQFVTSMLNLILDSDRLRDEAQRENDEFLKSIDENIKKIIKEQVKEQVKVQVSKILLRIEQTVNEQLEAEVLTRSSHSSKTSYAVAADLSEMELKKILIEKMEGNKSIQHSDEQRNLYKALVEAYESDKIILDTYEETVTLKRHQDDDADKDEEPSARPDWGSKRRK
nr:hypothetical protein [Tanacetum cinerariifolium]